MVKAFNKRNNRSIASDVTVANTLFARLRGLLGRENLTPGEAMWIKPCNWIHTIGMRFPIDILFLKNDNTVVEVEENIPPNRFSSLILNARSVVELPAGTVSISDIKAGDIIEFS
jgi:uncharacterized membrane protein (UPF0127 family)